MRLVIACCLLFPAGLAAQQLKPETEKQFDCYVQAAEARMDARKAFLLADTDTALSEQIVRGQKIRTIEANGPNPHKLAGGQLYDWSGASFIPGTTLERLLAMLQDYGHRARYFPETIADSKLLCLTGTERFQYSMRMKEPAVLDVESDVAWERVDPQRWRGRRHGNGPPLDAGEPATHELAAPALDLAAGHRAARVLQHRSLPPRSDHAWL